MSPNRQLLPIMLSRCGRFAVLRFSDAYFKRVLWLGEDEHLAPQPSRLVTHDRLIEDSVELAPFRVLTGQLQPEGAGLEVAEDGDLGFEFSERGSCRRLIGQRLFRRLNLVRRGVVEIVLVRRGNLCGERERSGWTQPLLL